MESDSRAHGESLGQRVSIVPEEIHSQAKANRNDPQVTWVQDPDLKDGSDPGSSNLVADNSGCQWLVGVENRNPALGVFVSLYMGLIEEGMISPTTDSSNALTGQPMFKGGNQYLGPLFMSHH